MPGGTLPDRPREKTTARINMRRPTARTMTFSPLTIILLVTFVDLIGFGLIIPLQAVYAERLGASGLTFGLLVGAYALMQLIFNPILGRWSDRIGRRPVLLISVLGSVLAHLLLGIADLAHSLPLLFVARILDGMTGANIATAQAYIADVTPPDQRARGMGLFGAAFGVGFVVGPALGALLALVGSAVSGPQTGTSWPAFGAAVVSAAAFVLIARYLPESRPRGRTSGTTVSAPVAVRWSVLRHPRIGELFALYFAATYALVLLEATFVYLCAQQLNLRETGTGLAFAYVGITMVIVQGGLIAPLVRRYGEVKLIAVGPFFSAAGFLMISQVGRGLPPTVAWPLLLLGWLPVALGVGLTNPSLHALISRYADSERQGSTLGLFQSIGSLARALSPPMGGFLFTYVGASWPYYVGGALFVLIGAYANLIRRAHLADGNTMSREPVPVDSGVA